MELYFITTFLQRNNYSASRTNHNSGAKNERTEYDYSLALVKCPLVSLRPQNVKLINITMIFVKWYLFLFKFFATI